MLKTFEKHLEDWNYIAAIEMVKANPNDPWIKDNAAFELMPITVNYLTDEMAEKGPHMVKGCSEVLKVLAEVAAPKESLISLIEHCEPFRSSVKFQNILPALGITMVRLFNDKKGRKKLAYTWNWTLETLVSHVHGLPLPEIPECLATTEERLLLDSDPNVIALVETIGHLADFLKVLMVQLQDGDWTGDLQPEDKKACQSQVIRSLVSVIGFPLSSLNSEVHVTKNGAEIKSSPRTIMETLIGHLQDLEPLIVSLISYEDNRDRFFDPESLERDQAMVEARWNLSMGSIFHVIYDDCHLKDSKGFISWIPSCYLPNHLLNCLLPSVNQLIDEGMNNLAVLKGIELTGHLVQRIEAGSLHRAILELDDHVRFLKNITRIIVYCPLESIRKKSFQVFDRYFATFDHDQGKFRLIKMLIETANHSGLIGYAITKAKDCTLTHMNNPDSKFRGHDLRVLVRKFAKLSNGAETDLLEVSDEVMAGINFLICMFLRDKSNQLGVKEMKEEIIQNYVEPIETGIVMSRAHYKQKLVDNTDPNVDGLDMSITVGGQMMESMTKEQKKEVIHAALNTFDMMECVLIQLKDAIE